MLDHGILNIQISKHAAARANAAKEMRVASGLRRDAMNGKLPRDPAISAARDCLRHARYSRSLASVIYEMLQIA